MISLKLYRGSTALTSTTGRESRTTQSAKRAVDVFPRRWCLCGWWEQRCHAHDVLHERITLCLCPDELLQLVLNRLLVQRLHSASKLL